MDECGMSAMGESSFFGLDETRPPLFWFGIPMSAVGTLLCLQERGREIFRTSVAYFVDFRDCTTFGHLRSGRYFRHSVYDFQLPLCT